MYHNCGIVHNNSKNQNEVKSKYGNQVIIDQLIFLWLKESKNAVNVTILPVVWSFNNYHSSRIMMFSIPTSKKGLRSQCLFLNKNKKKVHNNLLLKKQIKKLHKISE